jgi:uncharacterized protein YjaG (DUF416 family)
MNTFFVKITFVFLILFAFQLSYSQDNTVEKLLSKPQKDIPVYSIADLGENVLFINFDFASDSIINSQIFDSLKTLNEKIEKIDFVYTKFKMVSTFDQQDLNKKRLEQFQEIAPEIFDNNTIEWNLYRQIKESNLEEAKEMYHGFVVFLRQEEIISPNEIDTTSISYIKTMLDGIGTEPVYTLYDVEIKTGLYLPISEKKKDKGLRYKRKSVWKRQPEMLPYTFYDTTYLYHPYVPQTDDTVVIAVFNRNLTEWKNVAIVEDVTGSMYPYTLQTLVWVKLNIDDTKVNHFVFFNDGDEFPDGSIGRSKGTYYIHSDNSAEIENTAFLAMEKGSGGKSPENDIEAMIYVLKQYPECSSIVLIADNSAIVRDMSLLHKLAVPVKVILCGAIDNPINTQYLEIALKTGGSVHTAQQDIANLADLRDDETITIGNHKYRKKNKKFILVQ